jgi:hypothetical protein
LLRAYNFVILDETCVFESPTELPERLYQLLFLLAKQIVLVRRLGKTVLRSPIFWCGLVALLSQETGL